MLAFSPFSYNAMDPPVENSILFSHKFSNLFYYVEVDNRPPVVKFSESMNFCYTISKGIIDQKEIIENFENTFAFES